ncbi:MAG TPA: hypothetical protein VI685_09895 [Candidatus Angelobacter sp.]
MSSDAVTRRKLDVSSEDFRRLLGRLHPDAARAWDAYNHLRLALLTYFEHNHCAEADQLADETLDRIAKKPDGQPIVNVMEYAFGVARHVRREAEHRAAIRSDLADIGRELASRDGDPEGTIVSRIDMGKKLECLRRCMATLMPDDRELLYRYYPDECGELDKHRQRVAVESGLSWANLRTRMSRIRQKLEQCFEKCCTGSRKKSTRRSHFDH